MKKTFLYTIFSMASLLSFLLISFFGQERLIILTEILYLVAPITAFLTGVFLLKNIGMKNSLGGSLFFLVLGMLSFSIGEGIWFFLDYIMGMDPYPSIADFFLLIIFPISLVGLVMKIKTEKINWTFSFFKKSLPIISILLILTILVFYFGIFNAYMPEDGLASNLVSMLYGVGDLILIFACFLVLIITIEYRGGKMFSPWSIVTLCYSVLLVADVLFSSNRNNYDSSLVLKTIIDCIWMLGYFIFGIGMLDFLDLIHEQQKKIKDKLNLKGNER